MRSLLLAVLCIGAMACEKPAPAAQKRATLSRTGGTTFQLIPGEGQLPYCLAYTVSKAGVIRQLTMSAENESFSCPGATAVGKRAFKVPLEEGPVKVFLLFTSQPVNAASVSQQLLDAPDRQNLSVMNMRLPGKATLDLLEFTPEQDVAPELGGIVREDAGAPGR
jgi:hypothetical protein